jgi:NAD(P)-dependent dehydrogenase (short-subunit alcohol dehydrogenase family)
MFASNLFAGKTILVTGGGTGLGKAMAERFLALGARIAICGRRKSVCDATAAELMKSYGGRVASFGVDIVVHPLERPTRDVLVGTSPDDQTQCH